MTISPGVIVPQALDPVLHLVQGLCARAGLYIAPAEDQATARQETVRALEALLTGMWSQSSAG